MQTLLDPDTVLLQYSLGVEASYLWAVTREQVTPFVLADRGVIEAAAERALAEVKSPAQPGGSEPGAALREIASLVLAPATAELATRSRVVLALDGVLQYVPFAALPLERADGGAAPLITTHELVEVPSLSAFALPPAASGAHGPKTLAVFADPVLQASDPRFGALRAVAASSLNETAARASGAGLGRLLSTGYEGEAIAALVPEDQRLLASGFAANRATALDGTLHDFRYLHFATHGVIDARYPRLSALVLSQFDDRGNPQDGTLRLNDVYNMRLSADLVVLSACDTALGREVRGEGLLGLTQGFLSAGARRLVASLWQVPDRATAELMTKFYGYLLTDGLRPAEALRRAQMWSASQRRYQNPYYWGGFVLVGDWR
jgi:CHAT domain-containing protein